MGMVQRYLERRNQLPFEELDRTGQIAYCLSLEQSERDLEHFMPAALDGDLDSAQAALDVIKRRCLETQKSDMSLFGEDRTKDDGASAWEEEEKTAARTRRRALFGKRSFGMMKTHGSAPHSRD
jgi:hypothetical protein